MCKITDFNKARYQKIQQDFLMKYPMAEVLKDMSMFDIFKDREAEAQKQQYKEFYEEIEIDKLMEENKDQDGFCDAPIK